MARQSRSAFAAALFSTTILFYATQLEPNSLDIKHVRIQAGRLNDLLAGRTVAVLSDLHFGDTREPLGATALQLLSEIRPDIILIAGDLVSWGGGKRAYEHAFAFLARLEAPLGVYAVLGDADTTDSRASCGFCHDPGSGAPTTGHRAVFLRNESRVIDLPHGKLRIAGLDPGSDPPAVPRLRRLLAGDMPTILLSHSSVVYKAIDPSKEVLTVSGDTHGGQVWLPRWFWRLTRIKPDPDHISGFFQDGRKSLVVTRGIGTSRFRFRLGAPPEIVLLEFGAMR